MAKAKLNRECWARSRGGCSQEKSREHVVSKAVNKALSFKLSVPLPHAPFQIGTEAIKISNLCKTHNGELSEIDSEAGSLVTALRKYHAAWTSTTRVHASSFDHIVDGARFERWALKTLFNHSLWSGLMPGNVPSADITADHIMPYVFGDMPVPKEWGLFLYPPVVRSVREFNDSLFKLDVQRMQMRVFQRTTGSLTPEFMVPAFLRLTLFGIEMAISANVVGIANVDWTKIMQGLQDHPSRHGMLRPDVCEGGWNTAAAGAEHFTRLRLRFHW